MIFASAQGARGLYTTTADAVATLGSQARDAFATNKELVAFTELLNKTFVIAGTSATGVESTMYNLTQALASGVLRGQDLNAVMANAQPLDSKILLIIWMYQLDKYAKWLHKEKSLLIL